MCWGRVPAVSALIWATGEAPGACFAALGRGFWRVLRAVAEGAVAPLKTERPQLLTQLGTGAPARESTNLLNLQGHFWL